MFNKLKTTTIWNRNNTKSPNQARNWAIYFLVINCSLIFMLIYSINNCACFWKIITPLFFLEKISYIFIIIVILLFFYWLITYIKQLIISRKIFDETVLFTIIIIFFVFIIIFKIISCKNFDIIITKEFFFQQIELCMNFIKMIVKIIVNKIEFFLIKYHDFLQYIYYTALGIIIIRFTVIVSKIITDIFEPIDNFFKKITNLFIKK